MLKTPIRGESMKLLSPQLQAFLAICEYKTVNAAAEAIYITQTAVTQRIQLLERRLNKTLFIRSRRGMQLTPEGEILLRFCNTARELEQDTLSQLHNSAKHAEVTITIVGPPSLMRGRVIPSCMKLLKDYPNLLFNFDINDKDDILQVLRTGSADIAILEPENVSKDLVTKPLRNEEYVMLCTNHWKDKSFADILANEKAVDFSMNEQTTTNYLRHFELLSKAQTARHYVNRIESMSMMLTHGFGYGVLSKTFSQRHVDAGDLIEINEGATYEAPYVLAWFDRPDPPAYFADIIAAIE